ncbi:hypothetical protein K0M31_012358 [Melipona bicolor]|uniref:Takeout n=1 Tax=Melipona bicolor TaxID=60889 RepID=A0AA40FK44_9HYME|nr:hypothetical protein K0M31_012358 [Melipona bicolor]
MFFRLIPFLAATVGFAMAEVPSYIPVCGLRNPNLDKCLVNSMTAVTDKLSHGIPELDLPPIEPLNIGRLVLTDLPNFKAVGSDVKIKGLTTYHVNFLHHDVEKQEITMNLTFPKLAIDGSFNITTRILFPIEATGNLTLTARNVNYQLSLTYVVTNRGGKRPFYYSSLNVKMYIPDYDVKFRGQQKSLDDAIEMTINNNKKELLDASTENMDKAFSKTYLEIMNNFVKHFTYDDLLPDRE